MCGRFSLGVDTDRLVAEFGLDTVVDERRPRFNIAPGQPVPAVVAAEDGLHLGSLHWGLVPRWTATRPRSRLLINARAETAASIPAFRDAFRRRRCWILADGFYEWRRDPGARRVPFHFRFLDGSPFAMAGLWEPSRSSPGESACAILTTAANDSVRPVHGRMPVILDPADRSVWLRSGVEVETLERLLRPWPGQLLAVPVSPRVNATSFDDPACVAPIEAPIPAEPRTSGHLPRSNG